MKDNVVTATGLIDKLALNVVMLEPEDVQGWGLVLNDLDEMIGLFKDGGKEIFSDLAEAIKSIAERLALGEHPVRLSCSRHGDLQEEGLLPLDQRQDAAVDVEDQMSHRQRGIPVERLRQRRHDERRVPR